MSVVVAQLQIWRRGAFVAASDGWLCCGCRVRLGGERTSWTSELGSSPVMEGGISPSQAQVGPAQPQELVETWKCPLYS